MSRKQKDFDPKRNHIFAAAIDELRRREGKKLSQKEIAERMGVNENTVSRILNLHNEVTEEAITQLQTASGCIFNLQWLRGESAIMLAEDVEKERKEEDGNQPQSTSIPMPDYSSLMNATIAAQDATIASLKRELADKEESSRRQLVAKEETISALRDQMATKDAYIENLKQQVADLRSIIALQQTTDPLGKYPFTIGAADGGNRSQTKK